MKNVFSYFKKEYRTLNRIEISRNNILHNYQYLSSLENKIKIAPVLKSNGYGHGIINIAKILDSKNIPFFCVDSLFEAYELSKNQIKTPILVMGYTIPENLKFKKLPFHFTVYDIETTKVLNEFQKECSIHIFVDTGMNREGIRIEDLPDFLKQIKSLSNIKIVGLMSHLASAESKTDPLFLNQIKQFRKAKEICESYKIDPKWFHITASGGLLNPQTRFIISEVSNLARTGLALYGFSSTTFDKNLQPALTLITKIAQIKKVTKDEKIGYDGTYMAKKNITTAILPVGYYDGVDRRLSNKGIVLVGNIPCQILGRVSMNITIIDISKIANPHIGQEVIIYSPNHKDKNSFLNSAKICHTIPYDLLVHLSETTRRIIV